MTKFPTKFKDCFRMIRSGKVDEGIKMFDTIPGFEAKKNMALAEIAYFHFDWEKGLKLSCAFLPFPGETHYSNIFDEHFELILLATYKTNAWEETLKSLTDLLKIYEKVGNKQVVFQIKEKIQEVKNKTKTIKEFETAIPKVRKTGKSLEDIIKQQQKYKPKLNNKELEKADYLLYFLNREGKTADFIKIYEKFGAPLYQENHLRAAKEYIALDKIKKAQEALMNFAKCWWPIEQMQVEPVNIMTDKELLPALDKKFCEKILQTPKAANA